MQFSLNGAFQAWRAYLSGTGTPAKPKRAPDFSVWVTQEGGRRGVVLLRAVLCGVSADAKDWGDVDDDVRGGAARDFGEESDSDSAAHQACGIQPADEDAGCSGDSAALAVGAAAANPTTAGLAAAAAPVDDAPAPQYYFDSLRPPRRDWGDSVRRAFMQLVRGDADGTEDLTAVDLARAARAARALTDWLLSRRLVSSKAAKCAYVMSSWVDEVLPLYTSLSRACSSKDASRSRKPDDESLLGVRDLVLTVVSAGAPPPRPPAKGPSHKRKMPPSAGVGSAAGDSMTPAMAPAVEGSAHEAAAAPPVLATGPAPPVAAAGGEPGASLHAQINRRGVYYLCTVRRFDGIVLPPSGAIREAFEARVEARVMKRLGPPPPPDSDQMAAAMHAVGREMHTMRQRQDTFSEFGRRYLPPGSLVALLLPVRAVGMAPPSAEGSTIRLSDVTALLPVSRDYSADAIVRRRSEPGFEPSDGLEYDDDSDDRDVMRGARYMGDESEAEEPSVVAGGPPGSAAVRELLPTLGGWGSPYWRPPPVDKLSWTRLTTDVLGARAALLERQQTSARLAAAREAVQVAKLQELRREAAAAREARGLTMEGVPEAAADASANGAEERGSSLLSPSRKRARAGSESGEDSADDCDWYS